jgi:hypothetical protein
MKTKSGLLIAFLFISAVGSNITAGVTENVTSSPAKSIFSNFGRVNAHRQQQGVGVSWTVLSTQGVSGFIIERSYDGEYFEEVGEITCDPSGRQRFHDTFVYPGYLHYRIIAVNDDGTTEVSEAVVLRIVSRK